jgi:hypothetical protein
MAMTAKQKEKFQSEWKKPGNVKKNEIITPGSVVRGVAKVAAKVANTKAGVKVAKTVAKKVQAQAVKQNKKTVNKIADIQQKTKAEKIASNSVKTVKADPLSRASKNIKSNRKVQEAKSGDAAKRGAKDAAESNRRNSPYLENQTVRVKSGNAEPYKITGGAGSTARRTGEVIKRANKKGNK